jgi:hypothetical protein
VPATPIAYGGSMDPFFSIVGPCGPSSCHYGFAYGLNASPFDITTFTLDPAALQSDINGPIGFTHELSVSGPPVATKFEARPWVLNVSLDYCISDAPDCSDVASVRANGNGNLEFAIVMFPIPAP